MKLRYLILLAALTMNYAEASHRADNYRGNLKLIGEVSGALGGDRLVTVHHDNGREEEFRAGQGVSLSLGLQHSIPASPFSLKGLLGYKYDETRVHDDRVIFDSLPIEGQIFLNLPNSDLRLGAGVHYAVAPSLRINDDKLQFDNAVGAVFSLGWQFIELSYTRMDLNVEDSGEVVNADHVTLRFNNAF